jgi:hypothetical protein
MPGRHAGDPIAAADARVVVKVDEVEIDGDGEVADDGAFFHNQAARANEGKADARGRMNAIPEHGLEHATAQRPREKDDEKVEKVFHRATMRPR